MARLLVFCVIWACIFTSSADAKAPTLLLAHKEPAVTPGAPVGNLVVMKRRVSEGAVVQAEDVQISQADIVKIPDRAYKDVSSVVGKRARYDLEKGSILSSIDLLPNLNLNHTIQISLGPGTFAKLQQAAKKAKLSESAFAQKILVEQLSNVIR